MYCQGFENSLYVPDDRLNNGSYHKTMSVPSVRNSPSLNYTYKVYVWIVTKDLNIISYMYAQRMNDKVIEWTDTFFKYQAQAAHIMYNSGMSMRINLSASPLLLNWMDHFDVGVVRM